MREVIILSEILQSVRMAMHNAFGNTFLYIGKPIQTLASQHGKGNGVFLAHPLECAVLIFSKSASSSLVSQISGSCRGLVSFLKT